MFDKHLEKAGGTCQPKRSEYKDEDSSQKILKVKDYSQGLENINPKGTWSVEFFWGKKLELNFLWSLQPMTIIVSV